MPDQRRLLVRAVPPGRDAAPEPPLIPVGPEIRSGDGDSARSTYEARNLPSTIHDEALFEHQGTRTHQSEVLFEAVRGTGGTARLVLLPHEDHGYRARESIEHVLWEQLEWFDRYVKRAGE